MIKISLCCEKLHFVVLCDLDFFRRGSPLVIGVKSDAKFATDHIPVAYSKGIRLPRALWFRLWLQFCVFCACFSLTRDSLSSVIVLCECFFCILPSLLQVPFLAPMQSLPERFVCEMAYCESTGVLNSDVLSTENKQ